MTIFVKIAKMVGGNVVIIAIDAHVRNVLIISEEILHDPRTAAPAPAAMRNVWTLQRYAIL
jgi:hypothetical protein